MARLPHIAILTFFVLLSSCSRPSGLVVSVMVFGDPAELAAYEGLVAAFERERPDIDVQLRHLPGQAEYRRRLAADFASGAPPDVMLLNYRRFATFAAEGGLTPIGPQLARSTVIQEADFFQPAIESFYLQGQLWCLPQNLSSLVVYYNRDLFDAAGVDYPTSGWTWTTFLETARALTQDVDGDGQIDHYGAGLTPNLFRLAPFVWQNDGQLVDDPIRPTRLALDSPAALAAFQWFVDLQVKEGVVPDAAAEAARSSEGRFLDGRLAMLFNSRRGVPTYRTIRDFEWDVAPLPQGRQAASILHSDGFCLAASAGHPDAAWQFIEYANSVEGQVLLAQSGRTVPSLREVAESPVFLNAGRPPANSQVFVDTVSLLRRVPILTTWTAIEETASREIERAFYGQVSVPEAAATAVARTQEFFDRAGF